MLDKVLTELPVLVLVDANVVAGEVKEDWAGVDANVFDLVPAVLPLLAVRVVLSTAVDAVLRLCDI